MDKQDNLRGHLAVEALRVNNGQDFADAKWEVVASCFKMPSCTLLLGERG